MFIYRRSQVDNILGYRAGGTARVRGRYIIRVRRGNFLGGVRGRYGRVRGR